MDEKWLDIISRISHSQPIDLDDEIFLQRTPDIKNIAPGEKAQIAPSSALWDRGANERSYIGVRVTQRPADCTLAALRLAAAAAEREVTPIILTTLPDSGFERFGFRVERLVGDTPEQLDQMEQQLMRFWDMAIVIDVSQVTALG